MGREVAFVNFILENLAEAEKVFSVEPGLEHGKLMGGEDTEQLAEIVWCREHGSSKSWRMRCLRTGIELRGIEYMRLARARTFVTPGFL
jgi:hypothetical protein